MSRNVDGRIGAAVAGVVVSLIVMSPSGPGAPGGSTDVTKPPPHDEFLVIPLRAHVLNADELEEVDCQLADADLNRILGKVNTIWNKAGIHFGLESIVPRRSGRTGTLPGRARPRRSSPAAASTVRGVATGGLSPV